MITFSVIYKLYDTLSAQKKHISILPLSRHLSTEVELMWTTSILPESCRLVIEETLPRGMYVDPDQLRDLSEMGKLKTYVPGK